MTIKSGRDVKAIREAKGITQESLATMAGISQRSVRRTEAGEPVSMETFKCIAAALDETLEIERADKPSNLTDAAAAKSRRGDGAVTALLTAKSPMAIATAAALVIAALTLASTVVNSNDPLKTMGEIALWGVTLAIAISFLFGGNGDKERLDRESEERIAAIRANRGKPRHPSLYDRSPAVVKILIVAVMGSSAVALFGATAYSILTQLSFLDGIAWIKVDKWMLAAIGVLLLTFCVAAWLAVLEMVTRSPLVEDASGDVSQGQEQTA